MYTRYMNSTQTLLNDECIVARTDTIYGLLARAASQSAVENVYTVKGRDFTKPCIVLVADVSEVPHLSAQQQSIYHAANLERPTSLIVPASTEPSWITRGTPTVAYRVCTEPSLRQVIQQTGPLIAPSANPQGKPPAQTIAQAKKYFLDNVALYVDGGQVSDTAASRLMQFEGNQLRHVAR